MIRETIGQHELEPEFVKRLISLNTYSVNEIKHHARKQALIRDIGMTKLASRKVGANSLDIVQRTLDIQRRIVEMMP